MNAMGPRRAAVREMTIQQALEWAFAAEHARIDFDGTGAHEFDRPGVDNIWILQRQRELGCRVDGGGSSDPHPDAQIIAAAVEALPIGVGGKRMALLVVECARARGAADVALYMIGVKLVRAAANPGHVDSWVDIAGFAALGGEIATEGGAA